MIEMKALIVGGGIGGLTVAIALQQVGVEVQLFEQASILRAAGAGLAVELNAMRVYQHLGLMDEIHRRGVPVEDIMIRSWQGETLARASLKPLIARLGITPAVIHRAELQTALLTAVGEGVVHLDTRVAQCQQDRLGVTLSLADGRQVRGDLLIGADGIHSAIRSELFGEWPLRFAGYTTWRGLVPYQDRDQLYESWGPHGLRFGYASLKGGLVYWFTCIKTFQGSRVGRDAKKQALRNWFKHWHKPVEELFEATDEQTILCNDIYDLKPLPQWSKGRITLLGDAAHAMTPDLGQGASQAIEDALVLAQCVSHFKNVEDALLAYERRRIKRANGIVRASRLAGWVAQWENPLAINLRTCLMKSSTIQSTRGPLENIFGYDVMQEDYNRL
jgi:2-polyprenyl-6-methoxyphenol hydroxylase-like FAD-dependent oxidoreductase